MVLLIDIGNTNTHIGISKGTRVLSKGDIPTKMWGKGTAHKMLGRMLERTSVHGVALCSVVPACTPLVRHALSAQWRVPLLELTPKTLSGVGIDYPKPKSIGPDRLANALAARTHYSAPVLVVDFGTAVTFDVVDRAGNYVGGIIAPGLAAMTDYLHEKTALLPRITIREPRSVVARSTREAMLVGAVLGYRGLVRELIGKVKTELGARQLPVVATGGYGALIARGLPEITSVEPNLTLEGLRLAWVANQKNLWLESSRGKPETSRR